MYYYGALKLGLRANVIQETFASSNSSFTHDVGVLYVAGVQTQPYNMVKYKQTKVPVTAYTSKTVKIRPRTAVLHFGSNNYDTLLGAGVKLSGSEKLAGDVYINGNLFDRRY